MRDLKTLSDIFDAMERDGDLLVSGDGWMTVGEIAERLGLDPSGVGRKLKREEKAGRWVRGVGQRGPDTMGRMQRVPVWRPNRVGGHDGGERQEAGQGVRAESSAGGPADQ